MGTRNLNCNHTQNHSLACRLTSGILKHNRGASECGELRRGVLCPALCDLVKSLASAFWSRWRHDKKKRSLTDAKIQRAAGIKAGGDEGTDDDFVQVGDEEGCCEISHSDEVLSRLIYWSIWCRIKHDSEGFSCSVRDGDKTSDCPQRPHWRPTAVFLLLNDSLLRSVLDKQPVLKEIRHKTTCVCDIVFAGD